MYSIIYYEDNIRMDLKRDRKGVGVDWILLAQGRDQWRTLVSTVLFHKMLGSS
jgi:hypothetical protein